MSGTRDGAEPPFHPHRYGHAGNQLRSVGASGRLRGAESRSGHSGASQLLALVWRERTNWGQQMRHFLSSIALAATIGLGAPAAGWAQNLFQPVVYVNDGAVTRYEIDQRVRFMRLLGAPNTTAAEAEEELINDRLRLYA